MEENEKKKDDSFNTIASSLLEFSKTFDLLNEEMKENKEMILKQKDIQYLELFSIRENMKNELSNLSKQWKDINSEWKYENHLLNNRFSLLENRFSSTSASSSSSSSSSSVHHSLLSSHHQQQQQLLMQRGGIISVGSKEGIGEQSLLGMLDNHPALTLADQEGDGGDGMGGVGDTSFSYQNSFLFDPMNPVLPSSNDGRGVGGSGAASSSHSNEQVIKLSSLLEMATSRISHLENEFYNLQLELKSLQSLQNHFQILQVHLSFVFLSLFLCYSSSLFSSFSSPFLFFRCFIRIKLVILVKCNNNLWKSRKDLLYKTIIMLIRILNNMKKCLTKVKQLLYSLLYSYLF
jgi:hypothetical protein